MKQCEADRKRVQPNDPAHMGYSLLAMGFEVHASALRFD